MLKGFVDAYRVLGNKEYLDAATSNANFILTYQLREDGGLNHNYKDGKSTINGYLEDYSATIDAFITLYQQTLDSKYLFSARDLSNYGIDHFYDDGSQLFYFTSNSDADLVSRPIEYRDNVIPASNSMMAKNLFVLSHYFDNKHFLSIATNMLNNVKPEIEDYGSGYSNWMDLMLNYTHPFYEVAIVGKDVMSKISEINTKYIPNKILVGSKSEEYLPVLEGRYVEDATYIYVCVDNACQLPVKDSDAALNLIKN